MDANSSPMIPPSLIRRCAPFALLLATAARLPADLREYLAYPDPSYAWTLAGKSDALGATLYELRLTSQTWQGIEWRHNLTVYVPTNPPANLRAGPGGSALLMIDGGSVDSIEKKPSPAAILY